MMGEQLVPKRNECEVDLAQRSRHPKLRHLAGQHVNEDLAIFVTHRSPRGYRLRVV